MQSARVFLGMIPGLVLSSATLAIGVQAASADPYRGTMEQQMACTPDVWRLCSDQIPDVNGITACLQRNTPNLSSGCRAVFESNNSMQSQRAASPPPARGRKHASPPTQIAPPPRPGDDDSDD